MSIAARFLTATFIVATLSVSVGAAVIATSTAPVTAVADDGDTWGWD